MVVRILSLLHTVETFVVLIIGLTSNRIAHSRRGEQIAFVCRVDKHFALKCFTTFHRDRGDATSFLRDSTFSIQTFSVDDGNASFLEHRDIGESMLDNALEFDTIKSAQHRAAAGYLSPQILSTLRQRSTARVQSNKDFSTLAQNIAKFQERKNRKTVSLNEAVLKAELAEAKAEADDEKDMLESGGQAKKEEIFPKHYYNDEVLSITLDYLDLWKQQRTASR